MRNYAIIVTVLAAVAIGFAGGIASESFWAKVKFAESHLNLAKSEDAKAIGDELAGAYMAAGKSKAAATDAMGSILAEYYNNYGSARSAAQVSQLSDEAQIRLTALRVAIEASRLPN